MALLKQSHQSKTGYKYMKCHIDENCFRDWSQLNVKMYYCIYKLTLFKQNLSVFFVTWFHIVGSRIEYKLSRAVNLAHNLHKTN